MRRPAPALALLPHIAIVGVVALLHLPGLVAGEWHLYRDAVGYFVPTQDVLARAVGGGSLPHLNEWIWGGIPHLADPPTQSLYPLRWLTLPFPHPYALHLYVILHALLAGYGARRLARALGADLAGQALAGGLLPAAGFLLSLMENAPLLAGAAWTPWILALALELRRCRAGPRTLQLAFALAACLAATVYAGDPQTTLICAVVSGGVLVASPRRRRGLGLAVGVPALAVALSAAVLVPALLLTPWTTRSEPWPYELASLWSTHPWRALEAFVSWPWGAPFPDGPRGFEGRPLLAGDRVEFFADTLYVGPLALALGAWGLVRARGGRAVAGVLCGALLLAVLLALGRHLPAHRAFHALVGSLRYPEKFLLLPTVLVVAGAGRGLTLLRRRPVGLLWLGAGVAVGVALLAKARELGEASHASVESIGSGGIWSALLLAIAGALAIVASRGQRGLVLVVGFLALADPVLANRPRLFLGSDRTQGEAPLVKVLQRELGDLDSVGLPARAGSWPALSGPVVRRAPLDYVGALDLVHATTRDGLVHEGVRTIRGFASYAPRRLVAAAQLLERKRPGYVLRLLGVRLVVANEYGEPLPRWLAPHQTFDAWGLQTLRVRDPLPGAWLVARHATVRVPDQAAAIDAVAAAGFDPARHAVLEADPPGLVPDPWPSVVTAPAGSVRATRHAPARVELSVSSPEPATLLLSRLHVPGWSCTVDGAETPVHAASGLILGVPLDAGDHQVVLEYATPGLGAGVAVTFATLLWLLGGWFAYRRLSVP